jgi:hypothetical protein
VNSKRLPATDRLDLQANRILRIRGREVRLILEAVNLLDRKNLLDPFPETWPGAPALRGNDYRMYYTESGKAGGAYLGEDADGDGIEDFVPVKDPRVFGQPRMLRVGMAVAF